MDKKQGLVKYIRSKIREDLVAIASFNLPVAIKSKNEVARLLNVDPDDSLQFLKHVKETISGDIGILSTHDMIRNSHLPNLLISTQIEPLDKLLGGGLMEGEIYQVYGPLSGLINSVFYKIILSLLRSQDRRENTRAILIDTDMSFRPENVIRMGGKETELEDILVSRCFGVNTPFILNGLLEYFKKVLSKEYSTPLLIVNSILPISLRLMDNETLDRQKAIMEILSKLRSLAWDNGICILFGNHTSVDSTYIPGGNTMLEYSDHVLHLTKDSFKPDLYNIELIKSSSLPMSRTSFSFYPE